MDVHTNFEKMVKIIPHSIKLEYVGMKAFELLTLDPPPSTLSPAKKQDLSRPLLGTAHMRIRDWEKKFLTKTIQLLNFQGENSEDNLM